MSNDVDMVLKMFFFLLAFVVIKPSWAQDIGVIRNSDNNPPKKIANYSLGNSYQKYRSDGGYVDFRLIVYDNQQDENSLLNQLSFGLGVAYTEELYKLVNEDMYNNGSQTNPELKQKNLVTRLEDISKKVCLENNIKYEIHAEQKRINTAYEKVVDSLMYNQRLKYVRLRNKLKNEADSINLSILQNAQVRLEKVEALKKKYENQITVLLKERNTKFKSLPQTNFVNNKKLIQAKYSNIIDGLVIKGNADIKDFLAKYDFEQEDSKIDLENKIIEIDNTIIDIGTKLGDLKNNLEFILPARPTVDEWEIRRKMSGS